MDRYTPKKKKEEYKYRVNKCTNLTKTIKKKNRS